MSEAGVIVIEDLADKAIVLGTRVTELLQNILNLLELSFFSVVKKLLRLIDSVILVGDEVGEQQGLQSELESRWFLHVLLTDAYYRNSLHHSQVITLLVSYHEHLTPELGLAGVNLPQNTRWLVWRALCFVELLGLLCVHQVDVPLVSFE